MAGRHLEDHVETLLTSDVLWRVYGMLRALHPDESDAARLLCTSLPLTLRAVVKLQEGRDARRHTGSRAGGGWMVLLTDEACVQRAAFRASGGVEKQQDLRSIPRPYQIRRFVKAVVAETTELAAPWVTIGVGTLLYGYKVAELPQRLLGRKVSNVYRTAGKLRARLTDSMGDITLDVLMPAAEDDVQLAERALELFAPWWGHDAISGRSPDKILDDWFQWTLWEEWFNEVSDRSELTRMHALIDPTCAGLERLIMAVDKTRQHRGVHLPAFPGHPDPRGGPGDRPADSPALSREDMDRVRAGIRTQLERVTRYAGPVTHVRVDGSPALQATAEGVLEGDLPAHARWVEVFGHDAQGELPLSMFVLPDWEDMDGPLELADELPSGIVMTLRIGRSPHTDTFSLRLESLSAPPGRSFEDRLLPFLDEIARALATPVELLRASLLAWSEPVAATAIAASSQVSLSAHLPEHDSYVAVTLGRDGVGEIRGRFAFPARVYVVLYDPVEARPVRIGWPGKPAEMTLMVPCRCPATKIHAELPASGSLPVLVVFEQI